MLHRPHGFTAPRSLKKEVLPVWRRSSIGTTSAPSVHAPRHDDSPLLKSGLRDREEYLCLVADTRKAERRGTRRPTITPAAAKRDRAMARKLPDVMETMEAPPIGAYDVSSKAAFIAGPLRPSSAPSIVRTRQRPPLIDDLLLTKPNLDMTCSTVALHAALPHMAAEVPPRLETGLLEGRDSYEVMKERAALLEMRLLGGVPPHVALQDSRSSSRLSAEQRRPSPHAPSQTAGPRPNPPAPPDAELARSALSALQHVQRGWRNSPGAKLWRKAKVSMGFIQHARFLELQRQEQAARERQLSHLAEQTGQPSEVIAAAADFDLRHEKTLRGAARVRHLVFNEYPPNESLAMGGHATRRAFNAVATCRYRTPLAKLEKKAVRVARHKKVQAARSFDLDKSIWAPRKPWCDAKAYFDTDSILERQLEHDWRRALHLGVLKSIMRHDDAAAQDDDGDGVPDEATDVCLVLWQHRRVWRNVFSFYCGQTAGGTMNTSSARSRTLQPRLQRTPCATHPLTALFAAAVTFNSWLQFVQDASLVVDKKGSYCRKSDFDTLFIEVNNLEKATAKSRRPESPTGGGRPGLQRQKTTVVPVLTPASPSGAQAAKRANPPGEAPSDEAIAFNLTKVALSTQLLAEPSDSGKGGGGEAELKRYEFLVALVRIAINRYVRTGEMSDVSDAVERLLDIDIVPRIGGKVPPPDHFRRNYAYTQECNDTLVRHEGSLRAIFDQLVFLSRGEKAATIPVKWWMLLMRSTGFVDIDLSVREANLAFAWSRMAVADGESARGRLKETTLPFEGFIEAICRVSTLKALPSTEQVVAASEGRDPVFTKKGVPEGAIRDAGEWICQLRKSDPDKYSEFVTTSGTRTEWGQAPRGEPFHVRLQHTILLLVRTIELQAFEKFGDGTLTTKEIRRWVASMRFVRE